MELEGLAYPPKAFGTDRLVLVPQAKPLPVQVQPRGSDSKEQTETHVEHVVLFEYDTRLQW